jgi:hypothetical protein
MKQLQDAKIQDAGSTPWGFPAAILSDGSASVAFHPASWILHPVSLSGINR